MPNRSIWGSSDRQTWGEIWLCWTYFDLVNRYLVLNKVKANDLLPTLAEECHDVLGDGFIFQRNAAAIDGANKSQEWLCPPMPSLTKTRSCRRTAPA